MCVYSNSFCCMSFDPSSFPFPRTVLFPTHSPQSQNLLRQILSKRIRTSPLGVSDGNNQGVGLHGSPINMVMGPTNSVGLVSVNQITNPQIDAGGLVLQHGNGCEQRISKEISPKRTLSPFRPNEHMIHGSVRQVPPSFSMNKVKVHMGNLMDDLKKAEEFKNMEAPFGKSTTSVSLPRVRHNSNGTRMSAAPTLNHSPSRSLAVNSYNLKDFQNLSLSNERYFLRKKIGAGSFGDVYECLDLLTSERCVAKVELKKEGQLENEYNVYKLLQNERFFVRAYHFETVGEYNFLIMGRLQANLKNLFDKSNRKFSMRTTLLLADQMIDRLHRLHSTNFVHRDIKPENFMLDSSNHVFLIDFGLSKRFADEAGRHVEYSEHPSRTTVTGTARYASLNAHFGRTQSRRDDLEALCYIWLFFLTGSLPWQGLKNWDGKTPKESNAINLQIIRDMKMSMEKVFSSLPIEFKIYLDYCRSLSFDQVPEYEQMRLLFKELYIRLDFPLTPDGEMEIQFDWEGVLDLSTPTDDKTSSPTLNQRVSIEAYNRNRVDASPGSSFQIMTPNDTHSMDTHNHGFAPAAFFSANVPPKTYPLHITPTFTPTFTVAAMHASVYNESKPDPIHLQSGAP